MAGKRRKTVPMITLTRGRHRRRRRH